MGIGKDGLDEECKAWWRGVDSKLGGILNSLITETNKDLLGDIKDRVCKGDVWDPGYKANAQKNWKIINEKLEKIKNLDQITTQLSEVQQSGVNLFNRNIK